MGRKRVPINPECGKRVRRLIEEQGITQKGLAERINYTEKAISGIVTGRNNVTKGVAEAITKAFPQYREAWLMGLDDYKTADEVSESARQLANQMQELDSALKMFLSQAVESRGIYVTDPGIGPYIYITHRDRRKGTAELSRDEFDRAIEEIIDFAALRFEWLGAPGFAANMAVNTFANPHPTPDDKGE